MDNYQFHIFSPYRVCSLGAHVDHQHGLVTGFAINKGVDLWFNVREDAQVNLRSLSFEGEVHIDLNKRTEVKMKHWGDYVRGAKYALQKRFELSHGIDGVLQGSLPVGGLSSSAAVLIAYVMAFAKANGIRLKPFEVAMIASEAEREYIGLNNGLLDQACITLGRKDGLLFFDCDSNEWRIINRHPKMPEFEIGIFFSGLTRSLVNSDYNLRVFECKTAAWNMLAYQNAPLKTFDKTFLRDIPKETFDKTRDMMPLRFAKRAEHFYSEYRRVRQGGSPETSSSSASFPSTRANLPSTTMSAVLLSLSPSTTSCARSRVSMVVVSRVLVSRGLLSPLWILSTKKR